MVHCLNVALPRARLGGLGGKLRLHAAAKAKKQHVTAVLCTIAQVDELRIAVAKESFPPYLYSVSIVGLRIDGLGGIESPQVR